jgi:HEAT repeat protein
MRLVTPEQQLVRLFGVKGRELDALAGLAGGVTATHLRDATVADASFDALVEGLSDRQSRVRWWCVQVLDHISDVRALSAIASVLDDPVPRVRRNAAHAIGCVACKPDWDRTLPPGVVERLSYLAEQDPNAKVRREAAVALTCVT